MKTILIATERDTEQNLLAQQLEGEGYAVLRSRDGLDALELARSNMPQLLLVNAALPKLDGFALYRRCQQDEQLRQIPFVLFSTRSKDEKSSRFAQELGAAHFVGDALRSANLRTTVAEAISTQHTAVLPMLNTGVGVVRRGMVALAEVAESVTEPASVKADAKLDVLRAVQQVQPQTHKQNEALQTLRDDAARQTALLQVIQTRLDEATDLSQLFASSPIAMWLVDKVSQRILAASQATAQLFGYSHSELLQLDHQQLLRVDNANATQSGGTHVLGFRHKDGRGLSLLLNTTDVMFKAQPAELMAAQDVSYRVRGERALADEVLRLKTLMSALPVAYCICDGDGRVSEVNDAATRLLHQSREQLLRQSMADLFSATAWQQVQQLSVSQTYSLEFQPADAQTPLLLSITRGMNEVGSGLDAYLLRAESVPLVVPTVMTQPVANARLPALLEIMRYGEDAEESTLLQYAVARIAHAFSSPLAIFASLENVTQTMEVLAMTQHPQQRRNTQSTDRLAVPEPWRPLLSSRTTCINQGSDAVNDEALLVEGLPEISSYQACSVAPASRELWFLLTGNREQAYSAEEQHELQQCAELLGTLLLRKRQQRLATAAQQRQASAANGVIALLEKLIDRHDAYAMGSGARVASLSVLLARKLGLSAATQSQLNLAARLHDLGHVLLPQSLLLKPGALSEAETVLVRSHVEAGVQLLRSVDLGMEVAGTVAQHHERLDGSGYPAGLSGEQITLEARILAVADVVEAMCADRAHRRALGISAALNEIRAGSGRLFDDRVVQACAQVFAESGNQWPES